MGRVHGFRVFTLRSFYNRKKDRPAVELSAGSDAQLEILGLLELLAAKGPMYIDPKRAQKPGEPKPRASAITIGEVVVVREDLWHFEVRAGEEGLHPSATHRSQPEHDLHTFAAQVAYRITFLFPSEGTEIIVVSETVNRRDPLQLLFKVLTDEGKLQKIAAKDQEDLMRDLMKEQGITPPKREAHQRLLFERSQAADNAYIDEILQTATSATAVFAERIPSPRGGNSDVVARQLAIRLFDGRGKQVGTNMGRRWSSARRRGKQGSQRDGVSELADALLDDDLLEDDDDVDRYTDARIEVQGSVAGTTSIAVDTARDVFTYPVSDGWPQHYYYYDKVGPRVQVIAAELDLDVESIDAAEVDQCLTD